MVSEVHGKNKLRYICKAFKKFMDNVYFEKHCARISSFCMERVLLIFPSTFETAVYLSTLRPRCPLLHVRTHHQIVLLRNVLGPSLAFDCPAGPQNRFFPILNTSTETGLHFRKEGVLVLKTEFLIGRARPGQGQETLTLTPVWEAVPLQTPHQRQQPGGPLPPHICQEDSYHY